MYGGEEKKQPDYSGVVIGLLLLPVLLLFIHFDKGEIGRSICIDLVGFLYAIKTRWDLRKHFWFWGILVIVVALHIPILLYIPWPGGWVPAVAATPFAFASFLIIIWLVGLVERFTLKARPSGKSA